MTSVLPRGREQTKGGPWAISIVCRPKDRPYERLDSLNVRKPGPGRMLKAKFRNSVLDFSALAGREKLPSTAIGVFLGLLSVEPSYSS